MLRRALRTKGRFGAFSITPNRPPSHRLHDYNTPAPKIPEHLVKNFPASRPRAGYCGKFFYNLFRIFRNGRVIDIVPTGRGAGLERWKRGANLRTKGWSSLLCVFGFGIRRESVTFWKNIGKSRNA